MFVCVCVYKQDLYYEALTALMDLCYQGTDQQEVDCCKCKLCEEGSHETELNVQSHVTRLNCNRASHYTLPLSGQNPK